MKKLFLFAGIMFLGNSLNAQNQSWILSPNFINDIELGTLQSPLPQPTVLPDGVTPIPAGPSGSEPTLYYHGELPEYASNMMRKPSGEIEFFIVDGHIYDKQGYTIDHLNAPDFSGALQPATGASEVLIVPDPSNCSRYYIVSTVITPGVYLKEPYLFLLDMSLPNDFYLTLNLPCELKGALVPLKYLPANPPLPVNYISIDDIPKGGFNPPDPSPGKRSGVFLASSKKRADGSYKVFISNRDGLFTFTVDQTGFNFTNMFVFPDAGFNPNDVRGEMDIAELSNGNYRIAVPYLNGNPYPIDGQNVEQRLYTADITNAGTVVPGTAKIFNTIQYNPGGSNQSARYRGGGVF